MKFATGTLYSNSIKPVTATDRINEYGDTIWSNAGNGHDCIVLRGRLYGADMAQSMRDHFTKDAAFEMRDALRALIYTDDLQKAIDLARAALARCEGDTESWLA